jgi:hypothetical protein
VALNAPNICSSSPISSPKSFKCPNQQGASIATAKIVEQITRLYRLIVVTQVHQINGDKKDSNRAVFDIWRGFGA